jgi:TonB family protein
VHLVVIVVVGVLSARVDDVIGLGDGDPGIDEDLVFLELAPAPAGEAGAPPSPEVPPPPIPNPEIPPLVVPAPDIDITRDIAPPLPPIAAPDRITGLGRGGAGSTGAGAGWGAGGTGAGGGGGGDGGGGGGSARTAVPLMVLVPPAPPSRVRGERATLLLHIDETGRVLEVDITESSGDADYDRELRATALDWQFRPATHPTMGPIPSVFEISFQF